MPEAKKPKKAVKPRIVKVQGKTIKAKVRVTKLTRQPVAALKQAQQPATPTVAPAEQPPVVPSGAPPRPANSA